MAYQRPKGTADIMPEDSYKWQYIEETAANILKRYRFSEIRTPLFEDYELFQRGVGESSDIVSKEMYDFYDKGERHIALRPEGTASAVRAFVEHKMYGPDHQKPQKYYYFGPMFRYENPQGGRMRQFHQLGVEAFGSGNPQSDAEVMLLAMDFFKALGIDNITLVLNSLGDTDTRLAYRKALVAYLTPLKDQLSDDSKVRLDKNPLRILDSKSARDQALLSDAPSILDYLSKDSATHFQAIIDLLSAADIDYRVDEKMVRGLDYYTDTVFEIMLNDELFGSATTLCAGGRYDHLVEEVGGDPTPACGFAIGIERVLLTLEGLDINIPTPKAVDVYVVGIGEETTTKTFELVQSLRQQGFIAEKDFLNRKPKAQFKSADRFNAHYVMIIGEDELAQETVSLKDMTSGAQESIPMVDVYNDNFKENYFLKHKEDGE